MLEECALEYCFGMSTFCRYVDLLIGLSLSLQNSLSAPKSGVNFENIRSDDLTGPRCSGKNQRCKNKNVQNVITNTNNLLASAASSPTLFNSLNFRVNCPGKINVFDFSFKVFHAFKINIF